MQSLGQFLRWVGYPFENPALNRATFGVLQVQVPLMYIILIVSCIALAFSQHGEAPFYLSVIAPVLASAAMGVRAWQYRRINVDAYSDPVVLQKLRRLALLGFIIGGLYSAWAVSLYLYAHPESKGHIIFIAGLSVICCAVCAIPFRVLATSAIATVIFPFAGVLAIGSLQGNVADLVVAVDLVVVFGLLMLVLLRHSQSFEARVVHEETLLNRHDETAALNEANQRLANQDELTGLRNRRSFFNRLQDMLDDMEDEEAGLAVGVLDLDAFKPINDIYGHATGDRLLVEVASRLGQLVGDEAHIFRLGGDEFAFIIPGYQSDERLMNAADRICAALKPPFDLGMAEATITASLGLAVSETQFDTPQSLFEQADYALYHAKEFFPGHPVLFTDSLREEIGQRGAVERALRNADLEAELYLAFQPIYDISRNVTAGVEVLARWTNPELGNVSPTQFIPAAERAGMIGGITDVLFDKALEAAASWPADVYMSFNLSAPDLAYPERIEGIIKRLHASGFPPERINFEMTETALMEHFQVTHDMLQKLRATGAKIALDDFGTGYSSLSHLRNLPLDRVKLDRSFITDIAENSSGRAVTRTIVELAGNLGLECIAEGVETEAQLKILSDMGFSKIQGYLFSKPLDDKTIGPYLNAEYKRKAG